MSVPLRPVLPRTLGPKQALDLTWVFCLQSPLHRNPPFFRQEDEEL